MERVSRRRLLAAGSGAALASAVIGSGVAAAQGIRQPGLPLTDWIERYVLITDPGSVGTARPAPQPNVLPTGPTYYTGSIYRDLDVTGGAVASGAAPVGSFKVSAWAYAGGAAPQLVGIGSFDFAGKGKVIAMGGGSSVGSLAVSGGTGVFDGVGGEVRLGLLAPGNPFQLVADFQLQGQSVGR